MSERKYYVLTPAGLSKPYDTAAEAREAARRFGYPIVRDEETPTGGDGVSVKIRGVEPVEGDET